MAIAYGFARHAQIVLLYIAGRENRDLRHSVIVGLVFSSTIAIGLLVAASQLDGTAQGLLWLVALALDMAGPAFFGVESVFRDVAVGSNPNIELGSIRAGDHRFGPVVVYRSGW